MWNKKNKKIKESEKNLFQGTLLFKDEKDEKRKENVQKSLK